MKDVISRCADRLIENIVECKDRTEDYIPGTGQGLIENIVECKVSQIATAMGIVVEINRKHSGM